MTSLQIDVYHKLKNLIIFGELSPGEKLSEVELSKKLNSSRTPIREAFRQMQTEGYIDVFPNKGAFVAKLPIDKIVEIYDVISLLEGHAGELATNKMSKIHIKELQKIQRKLRLYASQNKFQEYVITNTEFHNLIMRLSGNSALIRINDSLRMQVYRYRMIVVMIPGHLENYILDHERILDAIGEKNAVSAGKFIREHVCRVKEILATFLKQGPTI